MTNHNPKPQVKMFGLIRDKYGKPKIDGDPKDLHSAMKEMLSDDEKQELGIE